MQTIAERFDVTTSSKAKFEPDAVTLQDANFWPGVRLELWEGDGGELPETVLYQHGLMFNLEPLKSARIRWSGYRPAVGDFSRGTFGIFPAGVPYSGHSRGAWRGVVVALEPSLVETIVPATGLRQVELIPGHGYDDGFIWHASQALAADVREAYPSGPMYGESIAIAMVAHLRRLYAADPRLPEEHLVAADAKRMRVRQFIHDQLHERLTISDMAAFSQLDLYSFTRWFKRGFGMPPHRYVLHARIEKAKAMLLDPRAKLVDVALQCGFGSQSHFASTFLRVVHVTPGAYRKARLR